MVLFKLVGRNQYHKNGTQWIGKMLNRLIGEYNYDKLRLIRRTNYAYFWYWKQRNLFRFQQQFPQIAVWFSLLNKADTSSGIPLKGSRPYERYNDLSVYNVNHEGWFQVYFTFAAFIVLIWNWWVIAIYWYMRGENVSDQDLYRNADARRTTNFDRTKYKFNYYFFSTHFMAFIRRDMENHDHPDNPRVKINYFTLFLYFLFIYKKNIYISLIII